MLDYQTQSNYLQIVTTHASFDWQIDWTQKIISGSVTHHLRVKNDRVNEVIFDTGDLHIESTSVGDEDVPFELKPKDQVRGSALHIPIPTSSSGSTIIVKVSYRTTKYGTALQWLEKEQTQGKSFPYLFSQCQPIYARSLAPLQDTLLVKFTYSAKVSSVLPVLLSAVRQYPPSDGPPHDGKVIGQELVTYVYDQPLPIPSYLVAIASGNVRYRAFPKIEGADWTSGLWTEPEVMEAAYKEFHEDTGRFLAAEEEIVTPYKFGVYDLLVLPPSFPYGGMENACLTFLTPTLITGDRSLVDVVLHELTHSWFGNGVTSSHFWLNEGWTTYMERLMQEILFSPAHRGFSFVIGSKALKDALEQYAHKPKYQRLVIDFEEDEDPDDAYSVIPYEKGANFLLHIERTLGGPQAFLPYVRHYVNTFMGQSINTDQWKRHLLTYYAKYGSPEQKKALRGVDFDAWLYGEGTELPILMNYDTSLADEAYALAKRWDESRTIVDLSRLNFNKNDLDNLNGNQIVVFLERLLTYYSPLPSSHISHLGAVYEFSRTSNAEIRFRFYDLALHDPAAPAAKTFAPEAANWITGADGSGVIGRMKFCRPVFRAVCKTDKKLAVDVFSKSQDLFHPIARKMIQKDLELA